LKRDLRKYAQNTNFRLVFGFILLLFIVGDGLIYLIYGPAAAVTGLLCILGGLAPVLLIAVLMAVLDYFVKKANNE